MQPQAHCSQRQSHRLRFQALKIAYSWKCNARCQHCSVDSHPRRNERLAWQTVFDCIDDAAALGLKRLEFTGGEILIFPHDLSAFLERSNRHGLKSTLSTNGFWAKDKDKARATLSRLSSLGVDSIILSTDSCHLPYIDLARVLCAVDTARELGLSCRVTVCVTKNDFKALEIVSRLRRHTSDIQIQNIAPFGRARSMDRSSMLVRDFEQAGSPCSNVGAPTVAPDGRVSLCCAPPIQFPLPIARISPLILGWLDQERLKEILIRAQKDPLLSLFAREGMGGLLARLNQISPGSYRPRRNGYFGFCDLCTEIFGSEKHVQQMRRADPGLLSASAAESIREESR